MMWDIDAVKFSEMWLENLITTIPDFFFLKHMICAIRWCDSIRFFKVGKAVMNGYELSSKFIYCLCLPLLYISVSSLCVTCLCLACQYFSYTSLPNSYCPFALLSPPPLYLESNHMLLHHGSFVGVLHLTSSSHLNSCFLNPLWPTFHPFTQRQTQSLYVSRSQYPWITSSFTWLIISPTVI